MTEPTSDQLGRQWWESVADHIAAHPEQIEELPDPAREEIQHILDQRVHDDIAAEL